VRKAVAWIVALGLGAPALSGLGAFLALRLSLPDPDGAARLPGLKAPASVEFDGFGVPAISARSRRDAFLVLGFVMGRDRLFQMDLARRSATGTLSEILGEATLDWDRWHRVMGFERVAAEVLGSLPEDQREVLAGYAEGVNRAMAEFKVLPFEFLLLGYSPRPWRAEDSLAVVLEMYTDLGWGEEKERKERAATVMRAVLPAETAAFLAPKTDAYTERLAGTAATESPEVPEKLGALAPSPAPARSTPRDYDPHTNRGSNAFAVGPSKTRDGRALLANDMHLSLGVPNIWYRAELRYDGGELAGLALPGVPLIVTGSNRHVAWGFTGSGADVADLVLVDTDPKNPGRYRSPEGWESFVTRTERLRVRGRADETLTVRGTRWGPVLPEPLLGRPVAVRWTALDPRATDLNLLDLDRAATAGAALDLFNRAGGPTLNALVADAGGTIGWTLSGRIPKRFGTDGIAARSWADGQAGWTGYWAPKDIPRVVNPPEGYLVNANHRSVEPDAIGYDYAPGYRAFRIAERLRSMRGITEADLLALQLDTQAEFYRYYRDLALDTLAHGPRRDREALKRHVQSWDGRAEPGSLGLALLVEFREELLDAVFTPLLASCREADPRFEYRWSFLDVALQRLIEARRPETLPDPRKNPDWNAFLAGALERGADRLKRRFRAETLDELSWERTSEEDIGHPLSGALPFAGWFLDMPRLALPGCPHCVRMSRNGGASERLVVAPGHDEDGILHMPAGQSGHPLSPHYRDQHDRWARGVALPLWSGTGEGRRRLVFEPEGTEDADRPARGAS
jgi:penicillin amidase